MKGVVAIRPETCFLSVDENPGIAHGPVKDEAGPLSRAETGNRKFQSVPSHANKGQSARTASMRQRLLLTVLLNGHPLKVVVGIKGTADRPVMGHRNRLPGIILKTGEHGTGRILTREPPSLFQ